MECRWLTISQTATYLSVHIKTCYSWAARGLLPTAKISGSLRIDKKKLDAMLEASERVSIESKIEDWRL